LLDRIWEEPRIVLWPAYGWSFLPAPFNGGRWFDVLFTDPYVQAGEIVGLVLLLAFAWVHGIRSWSSLLGFLGHGTLPTPAKIVNLKQG
jgi:hypothetical protein